jgi:hypothetical protein
LRELSDADRFFKRRFHPALGTAWIFGDPIPAKNQTRLAGLVAEYNYRAGTRMTAEEIIRKLYPEWKDDND